MLQWGSQRNPQTVEWNSPIVNFPQTDLLWSDVADQVARVLFVEVVNNVVIIGLIWHWVESLRPRLVILVVIIDSGESRLEYFLVRESELTRILRLQGRHLYFLRAETNRFTGGNQAKEHLVSCTIDHAVETRHVLGLVLVAAAVVGVIGKVDASSVHAGICKSHVETVIRGVNLGRLCVVWAVEEKPDQVPHTA